MDNELTGLLEQIRREGIEKAKSEAANIVAQAEQRAASLVKDAEEQATRALQQAKIEIQRLEQSSRAALVQAGRDLLLSLQKKLTDMTNALLQTAVQDTLGPELVERLVLEAVKNWKPESVRVELSPQDASRLADALRQKLRDHVAAGVEVVPSAQIQKGFRLGTQDGNLFYDFTPATLAGVLAELVQPGLADILKKAAE